ncbi:hypothetical protein BGW36DRAFT_48162 [Talaromyces proteolyticus]|uniref:Threonylcarbamoyl-AMP synthase n=1 Tax=Talaromyces proteolyticus TaxID=1131652 RepID=A0AAD4PW52_9EURO|nr:uncharacterized protein BGW36DRAFT_48162 [Talaromyces proteolyticus]KAH8691149.1 hypothetical protein BGW36DRAFT_48162 [Talaromyces proteolyticus]
MAPALEVEEGAQTPAVIKLVPVIDVEEDARRVFHILKTGGVAIIPSSVGYGVVATDPAALQKVFVTKRRKPHKKHAMIGSYALHQELHVLPPREAGMVKLLTVDLSLPLGVVAPFRPDHPIIQKLGEDMLSRSSVDGTLAMLVNGGPFQDELSRLAAEAGLPLMGSSANLTGKGTKSLVEDIEPEIRNAADIVIDYGRRQYSYPRPSSTMYDFKYNKLLRFGACYDSIRDVLNRFYHINLPDDPGRDVLFSGHLGELANQY